MEHDPNIFRDSARVIQEVEEQLDRILQKKFEDVDADLAERIRREQEEARRRKEEIEREFAKEKQALTDYREMVREYEETRAGLLNEARERFERVLRFQAEIESLARSTVEEIRRVNEIQERLEELRTKTSERAAFLKNDLRERFGIVAEVVEEEPKPLGLDLDEELQKLRKIKDLLAIETEAARLGRVGGEPAESRDLAEMDRVASATGLEVPEIRDLIAGPVPEEPGPAAAEDQASIPAGVSPEAPSAFEPEPESELVARLEACRRTEPANGSGEIHYFQKDRAAVVDPEKILAAVDKTLDEAQRLSQKLGMTDSPKDQFFIKQELINWQEGLRALILRVIKMCDRRSWTLPDYTAPVINLGVLRTLLERLSMENWSNLDELASFAEAASGIKKAFQARLEPRRPYLRSLLEQIERE